MPVLLENELAPITHAWGFLEIPFAQTRDEAVRWTKTISPNMEAINFELPLADALCKLEPLSMPPRKKLLLKTDSNWTAYFDNGVNGGDPSSFVGYLTQHLKCRGLAIAFIPDIGSKDKSNKERASYAAVRFELYAAEKREWLNLERSIAAVKDKGKWKFETNGTAQPFEKPERYDARAVKDRFPPELLEEYCAALGIRLFDQNFYGPNGTLLNLNDPATADLVPVSLTEARDKIGLPPSKYCSGSEAKG